MNVEEISRRTGSPLPDKLARWLASADDASLFRINVKQLAAETGLAWENLRDTFLFGVSGGAFELSWDYHCPHCSGVSSRKQKFQQIEISGHCPGCKQDFHNHLDGNVEVSFSPSPEVHDFAPNTEKKFYDDMVNSIMAGKLTMPKEWLSGLETITSQAFHEYFGGDVLSATESLAIKNIAFLFTDIKGSTRMYSDLGDAASYRIVRDHFTILFGEVEKAGGVVVKTIGDAIMAAFPRTESALGAAIASWEAFRLRGFGDKVKRLKLKMGIHSGPAIAVTLNDKLDYFGNTVNMAARIQDTAKDHTLCISSHALEDPATKKRLGEWHRSNPGHLRRTRVQLKGIDGDVEMYRLEET